MEAKKVIAEAWEHGHGEVLKGMDRVWHNLGNWQCHQYNDRKYRINSLIKEIDRIIDGPRTNTRMELGHLYALEEAYRSQRARV